MKKGRPDSSLEAFAWFVSKLFGSHNRASQSHRTDPSRYLIFKAQQREKVMAKGCQNDWDSLANFSRRVDARYVLPRLEAGNWITAP